jgi:hypothetical protein
MQPWSTPTMEEIRMSAEVGGYQPDDSPTERDPLLRRREEPAREEASE